jgi:predicted alpha/beta-hydrolase family hydrolase
VAEHLHRPDEAAEFGVALTHGAGAGCETPLLTAVAEALCAAGAVVLRYDLPFRLKKRPPLPATAGEDREGIREAAARIRGMTKGPVVIAGHSYGGRQGSMLAAEDPGVGAALLLLSYPLHPPGKPDKMRTEHLPSLKIPALFVSGERDEFGTQDEMMAALKLIPSRTRLIEIAKAGHDLKKGKFDLTEMATALREMLGL